VRIPTHRWLRWMWLYPPFLGAGVSVRHASPDLRQIDVSMKLRWWNKNYVGTQFGGSLYSMVDPFLMLMFLENLGKGYIVWDKAATVRFRSPGRGPVHASFRITDDDLARARDEVATHGRSEPRFDILIVDDAGRTVAEVEKVLSIKPSPGRSATA
jgi:hypothetical protein